MKTQMTPTDQDTDRWGDYFSAQLTLATPGLPHDIKERLRVARQLALSHRKPLLQYRLAPQANGNGTLTALPDEEMGLWRILGSVLPVVAMVAGLMAIHWIQQDRFISEIAAIDAALLTDELPPDAYGDAGFVQFLKQSHSGAAKND
jgi:hypothetical protein